MTLHEAWIEASAPPDRTADVADAGQLRSLKSWLALRLFVGLLGLTLPVSTWLFSALLPGGGWGLRGSLSAYYYSGMRELFTCTLAAIGVFLIAYKISERSLENTCTIVAGAAVVLVAFFPTKRPAGSSMPLTPLQQALSENGTAAVHGISACGFIALLAAISWLFGNREGGRPPAGRRSPAFWRRLHHTCAAAIGVAIAFYVAHVLGVPYGSWLDAHALWLTETGAVLAFAVSWTCKGAELVHYLGRSAPEVPARVTQPA